MAITEDFKEAVQSNDTMMVRIMLKDSLLIDPTCVQFDEMEQYASFLLPDLYVSHDGEELNFDVTAWDENYLNQQMVSVVNSFSHERIDLLKAMVRSLYKDKVNEIKQSQEFVPRHTLTRKEMGCTAGVAGTAIAVTGFITSHTLVALGGVACAIAGIALLATDEED